MDQITRTAWVGVVTPHVNNVPFPMSGHGQQVVDAMAARSGAGIFVTKKASGVEHFCLDKNQ